jgi:hypothetical protein
MSDTTAQLPSSRRKPHSRPIAASTREEGRSGEVEEQVRG